MRASKINYRVLELSDLDFDILKKFNRYQETNNTYYKKSDGYSIKKNYFTDNWNDKQKKDVVQWLRRCIISGGAVIGAFDEDLLVGFANVEGDLIGSEKQYVELTYIHVSNDYRGKGIGKRILELCSQKAKEIGAKKLYIGSHPAEETQLFYKSVGCVFAEEIIQRIYDKEPLDIQLECVL